MEFELDGRGPIYKQIVEQIMQKIKTGELPPGSRLPTERELAGQLDVARGTVKKAYKELADNNMIEVIQGSGSYVYSESGDFSGERRRLAIHLIDQTLNKLDSWGFSEKECATLVHMCMTRRERKTPPLRVAVIDCNPESLSIFKRQLNYIPNVSLSLFLVETILLDDDPRALLSGFDLVLTTFTHHEQIAACLRGSKLRLLPVSVSPSRQTLVSISTLPEGARAGIICTSNKFSNLILEQIRLFSPNRRPLPVNFESDLRSTIHFLDELDAVIIAPGSLLFDQSVSGDALERFEDRGGLVIPFDYPIERGSLIHIEEQMEQLLQGRAGLLG